MSGSKARSSVIDERRFASEREIRDLTAAYTELGLRSAGSPLHDRVIDWTIEQLAAIPGMEIEVQPYELTRWLPLSGSGEPTDLVGAGGLSVDSETVRMAGAVPYTKPSTDAGGPLVWIAADEPITAANARGKVRPVVFSAIPWAFVHIMAHHATADVPLSGGYGRPFTAPLNADLTAAGIAGAAGLVFVFDVPHEQIAGYFDPHEGTLYHLPAVYVGREEGEALREGARTGTSAAVSVRARIDQATTRNVYATLRGSSRERIVLNTHSDGVTWVQENGLAGVIALARHLASLPLAQRPRDIEVAISSAHLSYAFDGNFLVADRLSAAFDRGEVACSISVEHLGTREIVRSDETNDLVHTGSGEPLFWNVGPSKAMLAETIAAVKRRGLDRNLIVPGADPPVKGRIPTHAYMGGIGTQIHTVLVPTIGIISGPWSLWAPALGEAATDFARMRRQLLAIGDVVLGLSHRPLAEVVGDYPAMRAKVAAGAKLVDPIAPPKVAPTSGGGQDDANAPHSALSGAFKDGKRPPLPLGPVVKGVARFLGRRIRRRFGIR